MAVVTIIREIVRTGIRLNRRYKYLNINDKFIRKYVPPQHRQTATRIVRIGEGVALGLPIYEAIESGLDDKKIQSPSSRKFRQKRTNMVQSRTKRKYNYCYPSDNRYKSKRY